MSDLLQGHEARIWRLGSVAVILTVIPPGTTRRTGSDQMDGPVDLTSKDVTSVLRLKFFAEVL